MTDTVFPEAKLIALAELYENIGRAWEPLTPQTAKYRQDMTERAETARDAIAGYAAVVAERDELLDEVAALKRRCHVLEYGGAAGSFSD